MKRILGMMLACVLACASADAMAAAVPKEKTLENTMTVEKENIRVVVEQWCYVFNNSDLRFFVADVYTQNPDQLKTAFAGEEYSRDHVEAPSDIAARHDAVIAVNGDYYNYKDKVGMVIRNGVLYRDSDAERDHLIITKTGTFLALPMAQYEAGKGEAYVQAGVTQSFTFGPLLVVGGKAAQLPEKYVIYTGDSVREPRAAIGQVDERHHVIVVADGRRSGWSDKGMTLQELQAIFLERGCKTAYNMDGGGSAALVVDGVKINKSAGSRERPVSDILYFTN